MTLEELAEEMRAGFAQVNERLGGLESKVDGLESKVDGLESKVDGLAQRQDELETKMDELSETMDDRFSHLLAALIKAGLADPLIRDGD